MIGRNLPIRGRADDITKTAAPPRRLEQRVQLPSEPSTLFGLPILAFVAVIGVLLIVLGCGVVVAVKAVAR